MGRDRNSSKREYWRVTNTTSSMISIGDLPYVPTFNPNDTHDLLRYYTPSEIGQSEDLRSLLNSGQFRLVKNKDSDRTRLSVSKAETGVVSVEENELDPYALSDNVYTKDQTYTKTEVDAEIAEITVDVDGKADKVSAPVIGDFAGLDGTGNLTNSGNGPDDYYTKTEINALTYDHESLTGLQGGAVGDHKHLTAAQETNLTGGQPTFVGVTISGSIDDNTDAATKGYVDGAVAGASAWLEAVLDFHDASGALPGGPGVGDRYICSVSGNGWTADNVYEYNGATWDETVVVSGNSTYIDSESSAYIFNGTDWVKAGGISDHNSLSGLQGGEAANYWHLKEDAKDFAESVSISGVAAHEFLQYNSVTGKWENVADATEVTLINVSTDLDAAGTVTGVFLVDTTAGDITITISNSAATNNGDRMSFYKHTDDANQVIVTTVGGVQEIGGYTSQTISKNHQGFTITSYWSGATGIWAMVGDNRMSEQIVTVSTVDGEAEYTTIADAIAQINALGDASSAKRYVIQLTPGTFVEAPFTVPDYVSIMGVNDECTFIEASNNNATFITLGHDAVLYNLRVDGPTGDIAAYSDDEAEIVRCVFQNAETCVQSDTANGNITVEETKFKSSCTNGLHSTNSGWIGASNIFSSATGNAFFADGGTLLIHNSFSSGATNHLYCDNDGTLHPHLVNCLGGTNVARTGLNGTLNTIHGVSITADDNSTWHILQEAASGDFHLTSCIFLATKLSMTDPDNVKIDFNSDLEGDEGHLFLEEVQVGTPEKGRETVLGEGDSYTRGMLVYTETAGNVFVDVSAEAASASGSTFTFTGVAQDNAIYVSSDLQDATDYKQFLGIKVSIATATVPGAGGIIAEYWDGTVGGGSWVEFNQMSAASNSPYTQYGNAIFERVSSEQIRFDDLTDSTRFDWAKSDPPTTGTSRFWIRFRIATAITTAPIFQQFKVHTNRTEINADGFIEHMGAARDTRTIEGINLGNTYEVDGFAPKDNNVDFGAIINLKVKKNEFQDGSIDGFGQAIPVLSGLDTSLPLTYVVRWAPNSDEASGDVALDFVYGQAVVGTILDGTNTETTITDVTTTVLNSSDEIYESRYEFSVPDSLPEQGLFFVLRRDANGGATGDNYGGDIYIVNVELLGTFWH